MAWTPRTLADALNNIAELDIDIENNESSLIIKMNDYGDLPLAVLFTSQQIVIETYICPVNTIRDTAEFNLFLLRNQKVLPLSSVGITQVKTGGILCRFWRAVVKFVACRRDAGNHHACRKCVGYR
ncbi:putative cytoplasmic protein [Salmonella sp. NCTC 11881]|nr:putative cytoplasmic protein [Salmonella sp. NCTC 11881]